MIRLIVAYLFIILFFNSCKKENEFDCVKTTGKDISEMRDVGSFDEILLNYQIDLNISKGSEYKVEVIAGKNIIKNITTRVKDGVLSIDNINRCNFVRGYKRTITVNITLPYIKLVKNIGVGTLTFDENFNQDTLVVRAESSGDIVVNGTYNEVRSSSHGNGDVYLNGTCNSLYVYTNGTNYLRANNLLVKDYIFIETLSLGDCYVNASACNKFDYNIWKSGNIYYKGNPAVINNVGLGTASGKAIKE
jgi:hypothetical protein